MTGFHSMFLLYPEISQNKQATVSEPGGFSGIFKVFYK